MQLRASHRGGAIRLESVGAFRTTLEAAHSRIVLTVGKKLDDCFELADYRWSAKPGPSLSQSSSMSIRTAASGDDRPSEYLSEMADYLTNLVHSVLYQLPPNVRVAVYRGALEHIADTMTAYLTDPHPDQISEPGLAQFAIDVKFITRHAAESLPDSGTDDVFEELSQVCPRTPSALTITDGVTAAERERGRLSRLRHPLARVPAGARAPSRTGARQADQAPQRQRAAARRTARSAS